MIRRFKIVLLLLLVRAKLFPDDLKVYSEIYVCSSFQSHLDLIHGQRLGNCQFPIQNVIFWYWEIHLAILIFSFPCVIIKQAQIIRDLGVLVEPDLKFNLSSHMFIAGIQFNSIQFNPIQCRHLHAPTYELSCWRAQRTKITR